VREVNSVIIDCSVCSSRVDAKIIAQRDYDVSDDGHPYIIYFLECPVCQVTMLGHSEYVEAFDETWAFARPTRLWPEPIEALHVSIPSLARASLEEARKCFGAQAYAACAVMCGRALEAICREYKTKSKNLAAGLQELKQKQIIDHRLFDWGEALREKRNIGAHATTEHISRDDARDVLDFAIAFCEYVFVLSQKYDAFKERQAKAAKRKALMAKAIEDAKAEATRKALTKPDDDEEEDDIPF
jgi:hypothetical protein